MIALSPLGVDSSTPPGLLYFHIPDWFRFHYPPTRSSILLLSSVHLIPTNSDLGPLFRRHFFISMADLLLPRSRNNTPPCVLRDLFRFAHHGRGKLHQNGSVSRESECHWHSNNLSARKAGYWLHVFHLDFYTTAREQVPSGRVGQSRARVSLAFQIELRNSIEGNPDNGFQCYKALSPDAGTKEAPTPQMATFSKVGTSTPERKQMSDSQPARRISNN
jgi:hypothetical protein